MTHPEHTTRTMPRARARLLAAGAALAFCACQVAMVGDSITEGACATEPCTGWVELVDDAVPELEVVNAGCGATTTESWLQRPPEPPVGIQCPETFFEDAEGEVAADAFGTLWEPFAPYLATFVLLGNNDARFTGLLTDPTPIDPEDYGENLATLTDELLDGSLMVVLMTPTSRASTTLPAARERLAGYADEIADLCERRPRIRCGPDLREVIDPETDYAPSDGVHPNQSGHAAIADAVERWIDTHLEPPGRDVSLSNRPPTGDGGWGHPGPPQSARRQGQSGPRERT